MSSNCESCAEYGSEICEWCGPEALETEQEKNNA